ncbi:hypothetical protein AAFF_G00037890 [Aldrovandia affinis]|uniref:Uncharacterized protein n=1 Tax=Aldrovandia affinis TaxID=143900 RepID=A0AAD7T519_9TELE|nr:hypothetical protein AAFF_G00037890 [Aldrovandia affinis]
MLHRKAFMDKDARVGQTGEAKGPVHSNAGPDKGGMGVALKGAPFWMAVLAIVVPPPIRSPTPIHREGGKEGSTVLGRSA